MFGNNIIIKRKRTFIKFIKKTCYISIPIITILIIVCIYFLNNIYKLEISFKYDSENDIPTLIGISGTLIGFLFTAITIFLSLNKNTKFMDRVYRYGHHKIFSRCIFWGIILLTVNIVIWLLKFDNNLIVLTFLFGLEETLMAAYYTYILSIKSFK